MLASRIGHCGSGARRTGKSHGRSSAPCDVAQRPSVDLPWSPAWVSAKRCTCSSRDRAPGPAAPGARQMGASVADTTKTPSQAPSQRLCDNPGSPPGGPGQAVSSLSSTLSFIYYHGVTERQGPETSRQPPAEPLGERYYGMLSSAVSSSPGGCLDVSGPCLSVKPW